jgi:dimethylhistidine N-methyltransferase
MGKSVTFHDYKPKTSSLHDAVVEGLSQERKSISPKFFYDERGSRLFDKICEQPEYYPPVIEQRLLDANAGEIAALTGTNRVLIEPGAGSAVKVRLLLDALKPSAFIPMDISFDHLRTAAIGLSEDYPWLHVHAACVDYTHSLPIPDVVPDEPRLIFFPGSSIGNFEPVDAEKFLSMLRDAAGDDGMILIGVDTKKEESALNAAYNDEAGVTAEFNLNLLHRMRGELNMECEPENFDHKAFYNADEGRIEMHLVSKQKQTLRINGYRFNMDKDETLHTENSYKYSPGEFLELASKCGLDEVRHWLDDDGFFAIYLFKVQA